MGRPVEVDIMGQRLAVAGDESEQHIREVAAYVDQRMRQLAGARGPALSVQLALLTALNIASECWKLRRHQEEASQTISRMTQRVSAKLARASQPVRKGEGIARH